jgi:hypothetical protein
MEKAWSTLEELGAVDEGGRLTALGRYMVTRHLSIPFLILIINDSSPGDATCRPAPGQGMHCHLEITILTLRI